MVPVSLRLGAARSLDATSMRAGSRGSDALVMGKKWRSGSDLLAGLSGGPIPGEEGSFTIPGFPRSILDLLGPLFVERQMGAPLMVISAIRSQRAAQGLFTEDDDVVQTLAANRADQPFDVGALPGRARGG